MTNPPSDDQRCMIVVEPNARRNTLTLCSFRSKYEVPVRTVLPQRCDNGRRAIKHMTANVCGVHYRRLMSLHEMELHDGELIARHDRWPESVTVIRDRDEYV